MAEINDLRGSIIIDPYGKMAGKVSIIAVGESDISSSFTVKQVSDINSNTYIYSDFVVENPGWGITLYGYQKRSYLHILNRFDLLSNLDITPNGSMAGTVDIQRPPRISLKIQPTKDTFIRNSVPTLNYGNAQTLPVGKSDTNGEILRSLIQFDITSIPPHVEINQAVLRIANKRHDISKTISLNLIQEEWDEYGATWKNQPNAQIVSTTRVINEVGNIGIDVTSAVNDWRNGVIPNFGFKLTASDESEANYVEFKSKESDESPILEIIYTDWNAVVSFGRTDFESSIYTLYRDDLYSNIEVPIYDNNATVPSTIRVKDKNSIFGDLIISKSSLASNVDIRRSEFDEITSSVTARISMLEEIDGQITVSKPIQVSNIVVPYVNDLIANIIPRIFANSSVESYVDISKPEIRSSIYVHPYNNLESTITVNALGNSDLNSTISVNRPSVEVFIYVKYRDDLNSNVIIRRTDINDIVSIIVTNRKELLSSINVPYNYNLDASITVKRNETSNIDSTIGVNRNQLVSSFYIRPYEELETTISIRRTSSLSLDSYFTISKSIINSNVYVLFRNDFDSNVAIRRSSSDDLNSTIHVVNPHLFSDVYVLYRNDLNSNIKTRRLEINELDSTIDVSLPDLRGSINVVIAGFDEITSIIDIRGFTNFDTPSTISISKSSLESSIEVKNTNDIEGIIVIRQTSNNNIISKIKVPYRNDLNGDISVFNLNSINSSIHINSQYLKSFITVKYRYDLDSSIRVRVTAANDLETTLIVGDAGRSSYVFIM